MPAHAVVVDAPEKVVRERNRARGRAGAARRWSRRSCARPPGRSRALGDEGFAGVSDAGPVELVPPAFLDAPEAAARQGEAPLALEFGLQLSRFGWEGDTRERWPPSRGRPRTPGFTCLWLMDHFLQIPQVGREWEDMLESYTTLGYLAGVTERIRLGTLVTGVTYRNLAHLAKVVATLDVVSGGRALCGLGIGWFEREHAPTAGDFPPLRGALRAAGGRARAAAADVGPGLAALRGPHDHRGGGRRAIRGRCRSACRSSSAARASGGRCGSWHATPTPATCSATRRPCGTSWASSTRGARPSAATRGRGHRPRPGAVVAAGEPREGEGAASVEEHVGRYREIARGRRADRHRGPLRRDRSGVGDALRDVIRGVR